MRQRKFISILLIYFLSITYIPTSFFTSIAKAEAKTDAKKVFMNYKMLHDYIYNTAIYPDYSVVNTFDQVIAIKNGKPLSKGTYSLDYWSDLIGRNKNYLYIQSYYGYGNSITSFTPKNGKYMSYSLPDIDKGIVDNKGNLWFTNTTYNKKTNKIEYYFVRSDAKNITNYKMLKLNNTGYYLFSDVKDNIWLLDLENNLSKFSYKNNTINKVTFDVKKTFGMDVAQFVVDKNGYIWVSSYYDWYSDDYLSKKLKQFRIVNGKIKLVKDFGRIKIKDMTVDHNGSVWLLEAGSNLKQAKVKTIQNGKRIEKYTVSSYMSSLSIYDANHLIVSGGRGYTEIKITPAARASVKSGVYKKEQKVTLSGTRHSTIYYTLDGKNPTTKSSKYHKPILIKKNTILKFIVVDAFGMRSSIFAQKYTIDSLASTVSVKGGTYKKAQTVTIKGPSNAVIYYTLNGKTPTKKSSVYKKPIRITKNTALKFTAITKSGKKSQVYTEKYIIKTTPK